MSESQDDSVVVPNRDHIPGGWHSGFNRVYEWGYWAHLSPAVAMVYKILEWKANYNEGFTIRSVGYTDLARLAGVSHATVKRAIVAFTTLGLVEVVRGHRYAPGGETPNQAKQYRLRVPSIPFIEKLDDLSDATREKIASSLNDVDASVWSQETRPSGYRRPDRVVSSEPTVKAPKSRPSGRQRQEPVVTGDPDSKSNENRKKQEAIDALKSRGVQNPALSRIAGAFDPGTILEHILDYDTRAGIGQPKKPGWLVMAIETPYELHHRTKAKLSLQRKSQSESIQAEREADFEKQVEAAFAELDENELESLRAKAMQEYGKLANGLEKVDPRTHKRLSGLIKGLISRSLHGHAV